MPPSEAQNVSLSNVQQWIRKLREDPFSVEAHVQLADAYVAENRFEDAVATMKKAIALPTADVKTQERHEDIMILRTRYRLNIAQQEKNSDNAEEFTDLAAKLRAELDRLELDVYQRRSERYPDDLELRFLAATRMRRNGKVDEAARFLEPLLDKREFAAKALDEMGMCKQQQQKFVLALSHFRRAARTVKSEDQLDIKKRALYRAGTLAASMKLTDSARQYLSELVELDPLYKDAAARLGELEQ